MRTNSEDTIQAEVAVLGAGLAGLAAADRLIAKNRNTVVIEKEPDVGGMCRSFKKDGFTFDLGGHRFISSNKETVDYVSYLFNDVGALALQERLSQIYLNKKFLLYPPEFSDILKNLGVATSLKGAADCLYFMMRHRIKQDPESSLKDWILNRFGPTLYNIYFGPYSFKLWGTDPSNISSEWAPQRISVPNIRVAIKELFSKPDPRIKTYARRFLYPQGGIGEIPNRIARKVKNRDAQILTNHKVVNISRLSDGFLIRAETGELQSKNILASKIVSTIPLNEFLAALGPGQDQEALDSAKMLRFRSIRLLNLMINLPRITQNTWIYVPEREFIFFRIQELANWHSSNCPPGKTALCLEIACDKADGLWIMDEKDLVGLCIRDLAKMGIHIEDKIEDHFCTYLEHAYPVYSLGYRSHLNRAYEYVNTLENVVIAGRQGIFRYLNMDAAIESGFLAAGSLYDEDKRMRMLNAEEKKEYLEKDTCLK